MPRVTPHADTQKPKYQFTPRPQTCPKTSWWAVPTRAEFTQNFAAEQDRILSNNSPIPTGRDVGSAVELAQKRKKIDTVTLDS